MKEERDKLRALLNSRIPESVNLGLLLMQTIGLPSHIFWGAQHWGGLCVWLIKLPKSLLTPEDIEAKEIEYKYKPIKYKVVFYNDSIDVKELHIGNNLDTSDINNILAIQKKIQVISFTNCSIYQVKDRLLELKHLLSLSLSNTFKFNLIKEIVQLKTLRALYLRKSNLDFLPSTISNLQNLEVLDIRKNRIRKLPASFWTLTKLKKVYLGGIIVWEEPKDFTILEHLEVLELDRTQFVPDWVWARIPNIKQLTWIKTSIHYLITIGEGIGTLSQLEYLKLNVRTLEYPASIGNLKYLKSLEIFTDIPHILDTLPKEWSRLSNLEVLRLRGNFKELPLEWVAMKKLKELLLNNGSLEIVPLVYELKNLQILRLYLGNNTRIDHKIIALEYLKLVEIKTYASGLELKNGVYKQKNNLQRWLPKVKIKI